MRGWDPGWWLPWSSRLALAALVQSLRVPNNNEMRWHKDHIYESPVDILFLSQVPLHPSVLLVFILQSCYLLSTCIQVITVNTAWGFKDKFFSEKKKNVFSWVEAKKKMANWKETSHSSCRKGKLRNKCLPCKAPQWAIVKWCQIPYIISPGSEQKWICFKNYYPKLCRGRRSWKKLQCSHLPLSLRWNFLLLGEKLKSA